MGILKVSKEEIKEYERLKAMSKIAAIRGKIELFERKYNCSFEKFEREIETKDEEEFESWDDYLEWKAYMRALEESEEMLKEIEDAQDIAVTQGE